MSLFTIESVITRFLGSATPEVLAINGEWGTGKTHEWNRLISSVSINSNFSKYSYVSLFGLTSIADLKTAVFAKAIPTKSINKKFDIKSLDKNSILVGLNSVKSFATKFKGMPGLSNVAFGLDAVAPFLISNSVICFDDFERMSCDRIKPEEILGFISELKEEKNCKVVLIFNESKLEFLEQYKKYREKVIDLEINFSRTSAEAILIALDSDIPHRDLIAGYCQALNITNIRVLKKIKSIFQMLFREIETFRIELINQVAMTVVLLVWAFYDSAKDKPNPEYILAWNRVLWNSNSSDKNKNIEHEKWAQILNAYGLVHIDQLDFEIWKVIQKGYIEETAFIEEAKKLDEQIKLGEFEAYFSSAWDLFRGSFDDNKETVASELDKGLRLAVSTISPLNLSGTVNLLRKLDKNEMADELINFYIEQRKSDPSVFNLDSNPFSSEITDAKILSRFRDQYSHSLTPMSLKDALIWISKNNGWSDEHINPLIESSEEDYYELFKETKGSDLRRLINAGLKFNGMTEYQPIYDKVRSVLIRFARESEINAIRVRSYGITIPE